jgi:hypothetical protein
MSARPHETTRLSLDGFSWNLISELFSKICLENSVSLTSDKNNRYLTWRRFHIYGNISLIILGIRNVSYKTCRENQNIHFMFTSFRKSYRLWDNVEKYREAKDATDDNTFGAMRFARWTSNSTRVHTEICNTYCFSPATVVTWTHLTVTLYVHCLSCLSLKRKTSSTSVYWYARLVT